MPKQLDQLQADASAVRRELLLAEVHEAEAEHHVGDASRFEDIERLLDEISG